MASETHVSRERMVVVDALRGVALLAMIYTHMIFWYGGALLPDVVYQLHADLPSRIAVAVNGWLVLGKALLLFAFLFGLGFHLQMGGAARAPATARYAWRLVLLGAIGLAHHALWRGDILTTYALLGFALLPARRLGDRTLLALALVLAMNLPHRLLEAGGILSGDAQAPLHLAAVDEAGRYFAVLTRGTFFELARDNWHALYSKHEYQLASGRATMTLGFLLLGVLAGRQRWFEDTADAQRRLRRIHRRSVLVLGGALVGYLGVGIAGAGLGFARSPWTHWGLDVAIGSFFDPALVLFYASGSAILLRRAAWQRASARLGAVGRIALTSYLGQTASALLLFPSFGLALFGRTSPAANVLLALGVFSLQIAFAQWWLRRFRFGPIEWLWRSLTYLQPQPMRVSGTGGGSSPVAATRRVP